MKTASTALKQLLLNNQEFYIADLYKIEMTNGSDLLYTSTDVPLVVGGKRYTPIVVERGGTTQTNDISVDELDVTFGVDSERMIDSGTSFLQGVVSGSFENSKITIYRLFSPKPFALGMEEISDDYSLPWWTGIFNIQEAGGVTVKASADSATQLLNTKFPVNLYYPPCIRTLGDKNCGVDLTKFQETGSVKSASRSVIETGLNLNNDYLKQGSIKFTSGKNLNVTRAIKGNVGGSVTVVMPFYYTPDEGDTFIVMPACDKSMNCCKLRFGNLQHYRGYPFIPVPETAY